MNLTIPEIAEQIGTTRQAIHYAILAGKIPKANEIVDNRQLFSIEEVEVIRDYFARKPSRRNLKK